MAVLGPALAGQAVFVWEGYRIGAAEKRFSPCAAFHFAFWAANRDNVAPADL